MNKPGFIDYETKICSAFLNAVSDTVWDALGEAKTPSEAREFIGAVEEAPNDGGLYLRSRLSWVSATTSLQHNDLAGRSTAGAHPISAITGLQTQLDLIAGKVAKAGDTMTGPLVISANAGGAALRVTQIGAGNVATFEDAANPDASPTVIDANGNVIVGGQTSVAFGGSALTLQSQSTTVPNGFMAARWGASTNPPYIIFGKSRGANQQTLGQVLDGDDVGAIWFAVDNGLNLARRAAEIVAQVDGVPDASSNVPGRISFRTTAPGASGVTERMRIDSTGKITIGSATGINTSAVLETLGTSMPNVSFARFTNDTAGQAIIVTKSRGTAVNANAIVNASDTLLNLLARGADGTNYVDAASIQVQVDKTPGVGDMPGRLVFSTTADGAAAVTERMRIGSDGVVSLTGNMELPRIQIGVSATDAQNYYWTGSVANNITLKRGTPEAPGADVITVVNGVANLEVTPFGTFLPVVEGITTAGVGTYTTQFGDYRIVGKQVFFNLALSWTAHTGTGNMRIAGLPFANYNRSVIVTPFINGITMTAGNWMQAFVNSGASTIGLRQVQQGAAAVDIPMDTSGTLNISGFYFLP